MKYLAVSTGIALLILVAGIEAADAQRGRGSDNPNSGVCPVGTCASNGSTRAANIRNCKKENCRRQ